MRLIQRLQVCEYKKTHCKKYFIIPILKIFHNIYIILEVEWKDLTVIHAPEFLALLLDLLSNIAWNFAATNFSLDLKQLLHKPIQLQTWSVNLHTPQQSF